MESHELMRLLIPDNEIRRVAEFIGLSTSLLYQERRPFQDKPNDTGTRNTIERLDLLCEYALGRNPQAVRLIGERYVSMYRRFHTSPVSVTEADLLRVLGQAAKECGEAMFCLSNGKSIKECTVEVGQAKEVLEKALEIVIALQEKE